MGVGADPLALLVMYAPFCVVGWWRLWRWLQCFGHMHGREGERACACARALLVGVQVIVGMWPEPQARFRAGVHSGATISCGHKFVGSFVGRKPWRHLRTQRGFWYYDTWHSNDSQCCVTSCCCLSPLNVEHTWFQDVLLRCEAVWVGHRTHAGAHTSPAAL